MRRNGPELQRIVVDTAHDDDGYYFSIDGGEYVGPFATEEDRDGEVAAALSRIRRAAEGAGHRLRRGSGGSWVIEPAEQAA